MPWLYFEASTHSEKTKVPSPTLCRPLPNPFGFLTAPLLFGCKQKHQKQTMWLAFWRVSKNFSGAKGHMFQKQKKTKNSPCPWSKLRAAHGIRGGCHEPGQQRRTAADQLERCRLGTAPKRVTGVHVRRGLPSKKCGN